MLVSEIKEMVNDIVDDESFEDKIVGHINTCINMLAEKHELPNLFTNSTELTTSNAYIPMPENYHKKLRKVYSSSQQGFVDRIIDSYEAYLELYQTQTNSGAVSDVCVFNGYLYYQGIPDDADTLTLHYYRKPTEVSDDTDTPDIPCYWHEALLVNYCCWKIFNMIEDGIEVQKANTQFYKDLYEEQKKLFIHRNSVLGGLKKRGFSA